jgi:8-oxo-dGTP pyrophosphatase MutT (NUDIX family)
VSLPDWLEPLAARLDAFDGDDFARLFPTVPDDARPSAVLILFNEAPGGPELVLTQRAAELRNHARQISFPGGRSDPGDGEGRAGAIATALREAQEEVGVDPQTVEVFGVLPTLWLPPSNHAVSPVLGYWHHPRALSAVSRAEVDGVIHQPIAALMDPGNRFTVVHPTGWKGPAFDIGTDVPLWGFTAGLIDRICAAADWDQPWDHADERPLPEFA